MVAYIEAHIGNVLVWLADWDIAHLTVAFLLLTSKGACPTSVQAVHCAVTHGITGVFAAWVMCL